MNILEAALKYRNMGFSVIPVGNDKKPLIKWEQYQKERASKDDIHEWAKKWPRMNIGIVTGEISNILVVDTDTPEAVGRVNEAIPESMFVPCQSTPGGGKHFFFLHKAGFVNRARVAAGIDVRTNGGYVVIAPSVNGNGKGWIWEEELSIFENQLQDIPDSLACIITNSIIRGGSRGGFIRGETQNVSNRIISFKEGSRNDSLFRLANIFIKGGAKKEEATQYIEMFNTLCEPPLTSSELEEILNSAWKRDLSKVKNLTEEIISFGSVSNGWFSVSEFVSQAYHSYQSVSAQQRAVIRMTFNRLVKSGTFEHHKEKNGFFRYVDRTVELIDWENADDSIIPVQWPFEIERYVSIMPKNIIVIAGVPNAGKTAFMLNFARMNMDKHPTVYFSSEMEGAELKARLRKFDGPLKQWRRVGFYKKEEDFANALIPDGINIIDFLEITDKFYLIAERLREYHKRLNRGILVVAVQKDPQKEYGRGGGLGLEKPRLYMTLDRGRLKIVKGKMWASEQNPEGMEMMFKIVQGCKLIAQGEWRKPEYSARKEYTRYGEDL